MLTLAAACVAVAAIPTPTRAQDAVSENAERVEIHVAATEERLWVARTQIVGTARGKELNSTFFSRRRQDPFERIQLAGRRVGHMSAAGDYLYVFLYGADDTGTNKKSSVYRYYPGGGGPLANLPNRALPLEIAVAGSGATQTLYAVLASRVAEALTTQPATSQKAGQERTPFAPGASALSIVAHTRFGWQPFAACPPGVTEESAPRLCVVDADLHLAWRSADGSGVEHAILDVESGSWSAPQSISIGDVRKMWIVTVAQVPTIVVIAGPRDASAPPRTFRRLAGEWHESVLQLSPPPDDVRFARYQAVFGFNQHLGLLAIDEQDRPYLRFGRTDGAPAEPTVALLEVLAAEPGGGAAMVQMLMLVTLLALFTLLFVFRRRSMVQEASLPPEWQLALVSQRMAAWLVDLLPFAVAASWAVEVDLLSGFRELSSWAIGSDVRRESLPPREYLVWWAMTSAGYIFYTLAMELATRRTVGKVLLRIRLMSENGAPVTIGQILVRNLMRLLEMMPPLWALNLLALFTRNKQRLGDIFARTVVVRKADAQQASATSDAAKPDETGQSPDSASEIGESPGAVDQDNGSSTAAEEPSEPSDEPSDKPRE